MEFTYTLSEIDTIAEKILPYLQSKVVIFKGGMGFGKTTLIKALVRALGSTDNVSSPTFSLVNPYEGTNDKIGVLLNGQKELKNTCQRLIP